MDIKINATDIIEHLPTLVKLSQECSRITEMGVRDCVSTWAFIEGLKKTKGKLVSIDLNYPPKENLALVEKVCKDLEIKFEFRQGDTRKIEIEETDLLFIDTNHTYAHLADELALHKNKTKKYLVFHDTESCPELWMAIGALMYEGKWKIKEHYQNNNGLTICERI